ncbi:hypothetical protein KP509_03G022000 [Ceratopteris richardii]|uniref:Uncharacterized protein n=1 Tax=Ceratopteris richardii TaxID=49495 RepID=A0A8T2V4P1_CERRI|nr:hypothetical protein KP509_03G022000 [Ceratopteris richardii]
MAGVPDHQAAADALASVLPRVLIVSRRTVRKNKFVDFVGEYHLDLILKYGAVPVIVPRVSGVDLHLDSFEPIHGVLLCEGEDVDPSLYENDSPELTVEEIEEVRKLHRSDTSIDKHKDSIEIQLARRCLERNIPYLGICRGSQVLNVACGGSLYQDVEKELVQKESVAVKHINYDDYDGHRHPIKIFQGTPLYEWFKESLEPSRLELNVNSYHHQGVKRLAARFKPMAVSPCGLIEAFYDPDVFCPEDGKFIVGLQFHPERMRHEQDQNGNVDSIHLPSESTFDYPGCPRAYQEFVKAVVSYQKKLLSLKLEKKHVQLDGTMEKQRQKIVHSFCVARHLYDGQISLRRNQTMHNGMQALKAIQHFQASDRKYLEIGAKFLQSIKADLNTQQERMLKQIGATIHNSSVFLERLSLLNDREIKANILLQRLGTHELHDLLDFYKMMAGITTKILESRCTRKGNWGLFHN